MPKPNIPLDNPMTEEGVLLGRYLFYDPILSGNNQQSCGSCHQQKLSFSDGKKLAVGAYGNVLHRNTPSLVNLAWVQEYFWDGREHSLEQLVRFPVTNPKEMGQDTIELIRELSSSERYPEMFKQAFGSDEITMERVSKAIAQFMRTITSNGVVLPQSVLAITPSGSSEYDFVVSRLLNKSLQGMYFRLADLCGGCHSSVIYNGDRLANNLAVPKDTMMKIPALTNIALTAPYMHNGRFNTLREVLLHYKDHIHDLPPQNPGFNFNAKDDDIKNLVKDPKELDISDYELEHVDEFFRFFTDSTILTRKDLSDPFAKY
jgi:cytochrome c peroxidase